MQFKLKWYVKQMSASPLYPFRAHCFSQCIFCNQWSLIFIALIVVVFSNDVESSHTINRPIVSCHGQHQQLMAWSATQSDWKVAHFVPGTIQLQRNQCLYLILSDDDVGGHHHHYLYLESSGNANCLCICMVCMNLWNSTMRCDRVISGTIGIDVGLGILEKIWWRFLFLF